MKKEIWAYLETDSRGELLSSSKELLAKAGIIAATAEEEEKYLICALLAGAEHDVLENTAEKALGAGADKVVLIEGDELAVYSAEFYSDAIGRLAGTEKPKMILFGRHGSGSPSRCPASGGNDLRLCRPGQRGRETIVDPPCFRRDSGGLRVLPGAGEDADHFHQTRQLRRFGKRDKSSGAGRHGTGRPGKKGCHYHQAL